MKRFNTIIDTDVRNNADCDRCRNSEVRHTDADGLCKKVKSVVDGLLVIIPQEDIEVIRQAHDYVDFWKVGKLNHNKEVENNIDWPKFRDDATTLQESFESKYYIKEDLRKAV